MKSFAIIALSLFLLAACGSSSSQPSEPLGPRITTYMTAVVDAIDEAESCDDVNERVAEIVDDHAATIREMKAAGSSAQTLDWKRENRGLLRSFRATGDRLEACATPGGPVALAAEITP